MVCAEAAIVVAAQNRETTRKMFENLRVFTVHLSGLMPTESGQYAEGAIARLGSEIASYPTVTRLNLGQRRSENRAGEGGSS